MLVAGFWCVAALASETLYLASVRSPINADATKVVGSLYTVDPATGAAKLIAPLRIAGKSPIGVTGLAFHPTTGVLYGVTALLSPNYPHFLVTIDPASGDASAIGDLGTAGSDISFGTDATMFVWMRLSRQLGRVDLATGAVTPLGPVGPPDTVGGLAIDSRGRAYVAATGATGTLDTVDTATGVITKGPALTGAPYPNGINSLTISRADELFAVNTNMGNPALTVLVRIDPQTGVVKQVGPLPNDSDALTFSRSGGDTRPFIAVPTVLTLLGIAIALGIAVALYRKSRRSVR